MAAAGRVAVETDVSICEKIYKAHEPTPRLSNRWELRVALAELFEVSPYFMRSVEHGTVLPLGISHGKLTFFGGTVYCERNGFFGPGGGEHTLLNALGGESRPIRLLAWKTDPTKFLDDLTLDWDVPYNQYWILPAHGSFDRYLDALSNSRAYHARYLMRRFQFETIVDPNLDEWMPLIDDMMQKTAAAFRKRRRASIYEDEKIRAAIRLTLHISAEAGSLVVTSVFLDKNRVGIGLILREADVDECVYLLNLYSPDINDVSAAVLLSVIKYACDEKCSVDGLRGAFGLKKKYGFSPHPSYALVRDASWRIRPQTDLSEAELRTLYGRPFFAGRSQET